MGLLDNPQDAATMQMAMGLLQAGGPSRTPVSLGQAIGSSGQDAMQVYRQAQQDQIARKMKGMQMEEMQSQLDAQKRQSGFLEQAAQQITDPQERAFAQAFPKEWAHAKFASQKAMEPKLVTVMTEKGPMQRWVMPGKGEGVDVGPAVDNKKPDTPYFSFLPGENGYLVGNNRTGAITPAMVNGTTPRKGTDSPQLQADITTAKETAKAGVEKVTDAGKAVRKADQFLAVARQANDLLDKNPTHSLVGAGVDVASNAVGVSSKSAADAASLEALSGWLVSNVPRMEGPQSNFDVANYQTMAGKVGDKTLPIPIRKAALKVVMDLQEKYKSLNQDTINASKPSSTQGRAVVRQGTYNGRKVVQYDDGSIENAD